VQGNAQAPGYRGHAAKFKQQLNIKLEKLYKKVVTVDELEIKIMPGVSREVLGCLWICLEENSIKNV